MIAELLNSSEVVSCKLSSHDVMPKVNPSHVPFHGGERPSEQLTRADPATLVHLLCISGLVFPFFVFNREDALLRLQPEMNQMVLQSTRLIIRSKN